MLLFKLTQAQNRTSSFKYERNYQAFFQSFIIQLKHKAWRALIELRVIRAKRWKKTFSFSKVQKEGKVVPWSKNLLLGGVGLRQKKSFRNFWVIYLLMQKSVQALSAFLNLKSSSDTRKILIDIFQLRSSTRNGAVIKIFSFIKLSSIESEVSSIEYVM